MNTHNVKSNSYIHTFAFLVLVSLLSNCERNTLELPQVVETTPDIELDMLVDGVAVMATAGVDNIFNDTGFLLDQNDVYTFLGTMTTADCGMDCPNSFSMRIRNIGQGTSNFDVAESISLGSYKFKNDAQPISDAFLLDFDISTQAIEPQYSWLIERTNTTYTQESSNDLRVLDIENTSEAFAIVTVLDEATDLTSFYTEQLQLNNSNVEAVSSRIMVEQIEEDSVALTIVHTPSVDFLPLEVTQWGFIDLNGENPVLSTVPKDEVMHIRIGNGKNIRNITNFSSDSDGTRTTVGLDIRYENNQGLIFHEVDFDYSIIERIVDGSSLALQTFEFILVDENGTVFSSANGEQTEDALFEITKVEPFIENDKGQTTVKIDCKFSCTVYAEDGSQKNIQNAKATIALATPK